MIYKEAPFKLGFTVIAMVFLLKIKSGDAHPKTQWQDLRRKNHRQNLKPPGGEPSSESRECAAKKSEGLSRGTGSPSTSQWAKAIEGLRSEYPLGLLLELRKMARSVFYYHLKRLNGKDKYAVEKKEIKDVFHEHRGRYGHRCITDEMHNRRYVINHKTVQRLMYEVGPLATSINRYSATVSSFGLSISFRTSLNCAGVRLRALIDRIAVLISESFCMMSRLYTDALG